MTLAAGSLSDRVTILDGSERERSASGQATQRWRDREERWARVEDLSASLAEKASAAGVRVRTMVTLREPIELEAFVNAIRFESRGRTRILNVVEVRRMPSAEYVEVFCTEIA
ncbi:MAG: head-tail adaptor protein [Planctomycetes bacterium]|nr:head-tail adaptor protein [Planctomycetota bacterium]